MSILPTKLLSARITSIQDQAFWMEDDGSGDPWIGYPYRWTVNMVVDITSHSSHMTANPFYYTAEDVKVGDWIASAPGGGAVQITEISEVNGSLVTCIVEDVERFNTFNDQSQSGIGSIPEGQAYIFEVNEDGIPVLTGVPSAVLPASFQTDLVSRFAYRNTETNFIRVNQVEHAMEVGDVIRPDFNIVGQYVKAIADGKVNYAIGVVNSIGTPGLDWFTFKPFGTVAEKVAPDLIGNYGDLFYIDPVQPGKLTNVRPATNARPIYLRLDRPNRAIMLQMSGDDIAGETQKVHIEVETDGQLEFTLPGDAMNVEFMAINGIENTNFTFDQLTKVLTFDPVATGYGVETTDEVFFIYKS